MAKIKKIFFKEKKEKKRRKIKNRKEIYKEN